MTLWNLIRDFFVQNIFGGITSNDIAFNSNYVGYLVDESDGTVSIANSQGLCLSLGKAFDMDNGIVANYIGLGDWLSTTFTVITLILLVVFLYLFVKWIFKLFSGLLH